MIKKLKLKKKTNIFTLTKSRMHKWKRYWKKNWSKINKKNENERKNKNKKPLSRCKMSRDMDGERWRAGVPLFIQQKMLKKRERE